MSKNFISNVSNFLMYSGLFASILMVGVEFFKYSGFLQNNTGLPLWMYMLIFPGFLLSISLCRHIVKRRFQIPKQLIQFNNYFLFPTSIVMLALFASLEIYNYPNYVFSTFGVNHLALIDLITFSFINVLLSLSKKNYLQSWPILLLASFLLVCTFLYIHYFNLFFLLSANLSYRDDDKFMEQLQVVVLSIGIGVTLTLSHLTKKDALKKITYYVITIIFFVFIGEEISWGQRIFNYSPVSLEENYQQEINLHNKPVLNEITALLYPIAFIYALFSWVIYNKIKKKKKLTTNQQSWLEIFCFKRNEIAYFIPTLIFNPYASNTIIRGYPPLIDYYHQIGLAPNLEKAQNFLGQWRETFEVIFYLGLVIHFVQILITNRRTNKNI